MIIMKKKYLRKFYISKFLIKKHKKKSGTDFHAKISRERRRVMTSGFFVIGWGTLKLIIIDWNRAGGLSKRSAVFADRTRF